MRDEAISERKLAKKEKKLAGGGGGASRLPGCGWRDGRIIVLVELLNSFIAPEQNTHKNKKKMISERLSDYGWDNTAALEVSGSSGFCSYGSSC